MLDKAGFCLYINRPQFFVFLQFSLLKLKEKSIKMITIKNISYPSFKIDPFALLQTQDYIVTFPPYYPLSG